MKKSHKSDSSEYYDACEDLEDFNEPYYSASFFTNPTKFGADKTTSSSFDSYSKIKPHSVSYLSTNSSLHKSSKTTQSRSQHYLPLRKDSTKPEQAQKFTSLFMAQEIDLVQRNTSDVWILKFSRDSK